MANGWTGNILRVNLTTGNITLEDSSKFKSFVGGMGFGYKIMYDEVPPGTKPFDEANKLVFATGPLTGSGAPCSSRVNITSPSAAPQNSPLRAVQRDLGSEYSAHDCGVLGTTWLLFAPISSVNIADRQEMKRLNDYM
ncbi:aldehyde ferredoxin oxidoreductase N-terminal domain-containing protein, partial [Escherichia sp. TWPC-MK]